MKILLVLPRGDLYRYRSGIFKRSLCYAPITLTTLAGLVPPEIDADIEIVDEGVQVLDRDTRADLVAISIITGTAPRGYEIADHFRSRGIPVVLGGVHPTLMPEEARMHADTVVTGYAEKTWPMLLRDFSNGGMKDIYSSDPDMVLQDIPLPRRDLLDRRKFISVNSVQATRGCLQRCKFCVVHVLCRGKMYLRPVGEVIREIETLEGREVIFLDPSPLEDVGYAKELFRALVPLGKKWVGLATTKVTDDPELLSLMVSSGCRGLLIGFESISQPAVDESDKEFNRVERYRRIVSELHYNGIAVQGTFIFGFDSDDRDVFARTADFALDAAIDLPRYAVYTPFPGTPAFTELEDQGRITTRDWSLYDGQHVVFRPAGMTASELQEGLYEAWRRTYSLGSIFRRLNRSRCILGASIPANIGYRHYARNLSAPAGAAIRE